MDKGMLREREPVLADTVGLMAFNERFGLELSVNELHAGVSGLSGFAFGGGPSALAAWPWAGGFMRMLSALQSPNQKR